MLAIFRDYVLAERSVEVLLAWRMVVDLLGDFSEGFGFLVVFLLTQVYSGNQSHPDLAAGVVRSFHQSDISSEGATLFDPYPLVVLKLKILGFVALVDVRHLLLGHEHVLLEDEVQSSAGLLHVDFLKSLNVDPAFS